MRIPSHIQRKIDKLREAAGVTAEDMSDFMPGHPVLSSDLVTTAMQIDLMERQAKLVLEAIKCGAIAHQEGAPFILAFLGLKVE